MLLQSITVIMSYDQNVAEWDTISDKYEIGVLVICVNQILVNIKFLLNFVPAFAIWLYAVFPMKVGRVLVQGNNCV